MESRERETADKGDYKILPHGERLGTGAGSGSPPLAMAGTKLGMPNQAKGEVLQETLARLLAVCFELPAHRPSECVPGVGPASWPQRFDPRWPRRGVTPRTSERRAFDAL
jgi:hypothetical protein